MLSRDKVQPLHGSYAKLRLFQPIPTDVFALLTTDQLQQIWKNRFNILTELDNLIDAHYKQYFESLKLSYTDPLEASFIKFGHEGNRAKRYAETLANKNEYRPALAHLQQAIDTSLMIYKIFSGREPLSGDGIETYYQRAASLS
jgi:hypothetical protein